MERRGTRGQGIKAVFSQVQRLDLNTLTVEQLYELPWGGRRLGRKAGLTPCLCRGRWGGGCPRKD